MNRSTFNVILGDQDYRDGERRVHEPLPPHHEVSFLGGIGIGFTILALSVAAIWIAHWFWGV